MQRKNLLISIGMTLFLIVLASFLYVFTYRTIKDTFFSATVEQTMEVIDVVRDVGIQSVDSRLRMIKISLEEAASQNSSQFTDESPEVKSAALSKLKLPPDGIGYWLAAPDGTGLDSRGDKIDWRGELDLEAVFSSGKTTVLDPYFDQEGTYIVSVAAPLRSDDPFAGLLVLRLDGFCLSRWIGSVQFETGRGMAYMVDSRGTNIADSREENYNWITEQYNAQKLEGSSKESSSVAQLERLALEGKKGRGSYLWEGKRSYVAYGPIEEADWGFYAGFYGGLMNDFIEARARQSIVSSIPLFAVLLTFLVSLIIYANYNLRKERGYVKKLVLQKEEIQKQAEELLISEERFRVALAQTKNVIFEYDTRTGDVTNFCAARMLTCDTNSVEHLKNHFISGCVIDDESVVHLKQILDGIRGGISEKECIIKCYSGEGALNWYKISITSLPQQQNRAIGILENVTKEKLAELDPLTGLLNKKVITEQVSAHLSKMNGSGTCAFLMFDIDNFKNVNDTYGHLAGDQIIIQTSAVLKNVFSRNALAGRVGGDEFCVFCYGSPTPQSLKDSLRTVEWQIGLAEGDGSVTLSCGIALGSGPVESFEALYRKADEALYKAKLGGKKQYCFYSEIEG